MKKLKSIVFLIAVFFMLPMVANAAEANVVIDNVTLESKTDGAVQNADPTYNGLNIGFDTKFTSVGDNIVYKVTLSNKDKQDYTLANASYKDGDYITYEYSFSDNSSVLKGNSTKVMYITIKYAKQVPEGQLTDGKYTKNSTIAINLSDKSGSSVGATNPKTGSSLLLIFIVMALVIGGLSLIFFRNRKGVKTMGMLLAMGLFIIPTSIYAMKAVTINVNSNVEISTLPQFCAFNEVAFFKDGGDISKVDNYYTYHEFVVGMTFGEFFDTYKDTKLYYGEDGIRYYAYDEEKHDFTKLRNYLTSEDIGPYVGDLQDLDSVIQDKTKACYLIQFKED